MTIKTINNTLLKISVFLFALNYSYSQEKTNKSFTLEGKLTTDYSGYIFLNYENKKDSCLIVNNHFSFKGNIENEVSGAGLHLDKPSSIAGVYLENAAIEIEIEIETKELKTENGTLLLLTTTFVKGTKTSKIEEEFEKFKNENKSSKNFTQKYIDKVEDIVTQNPKNPFGSDLLCGLSRDKDLDKTQLRRIYSKVDKKIIDKITKRVIEKNLFPEEHVSVNDLVFDFTLLDRNDKNFDTKSLKGKWFLIDFWASWCGPCRQQLPELKKIYTENKKRNFEIVTVSIDENKLKWVQALDKEKLDWINVNENKSFEGKIAIKYNVDAIPMNYLINSEGKIVAQNIEMKDLEKLLKDL